MSKLLEIYECGQCHNFAIQQGTGKFCCSLTGYEMVIETSTTIPEECPLPDATEVPPNKDKEEMYVALDNDGQIVAICDTDPQTAKHCLWDWLCEDMQVDRMDKDTVMEAYMSHGKEDEDND